MELMIWTSKPRPINNPIVEITLTMATIIGAMIRLSLRKNKSNSKKIANPANGADVAICTSISTPKVSSATGRPVIYSWSSAGQSLVNALTMLATL